MKRILVLHSGGLDSTVCLLMAKSKDYTVLSLGVDYNQRHKIEVLYAKTQCEKFNIERQLININWLKPVRDTPLDREKKEIGLEPSVAFLPGRNVVFLSLAMAHAAGWQADEVWTGINSVDFSGYPDCTPEFLSAYKTMYNIAAPSKLTIEAPLQNMTKPEIANLAKSFGLTKNDTWSCYRPQITERGVVPCERCDACKLHTFAWESHQYDDIIK